MHLLVMLRPLLQVAADRRRMWGDHVPNGDHVRRVRPQEILPARASYVELGFHGLHQGRSEAVAVVHRTSNGRDAFHPEAADSTKSMQHAHYKQSTSVGTPKASHMSV